MLHSTSHGFTAALWKVCCSWRRKHYRHQVAWMGDETRKNIMRWTLTVMQGKRHYMQEMMCLMFIAHDRWAIRNLCNDRWSSCWKWKTKEITWRVFYSKEEHFLWNLQVQTNVKEILKTDLLSTPVFKEWQLYVNLVVLLRIFWHKLFKDAALLEYAGKPWKITWIWN